MPSLLWTDAVGPGLWYSHGRSPGFAAAPGFRPEQTRVLMEVSMNTIYHWQNEVMVSLEMEEFRREIDSIRLIQDAGLSNPGLFERAAIAVGNALVRAGQRMHKNFTDPN